LETWLCGRTKKVQVIGMNEASINDDPDRLDMWSGDIFSPY